MMFSVTPIRDRDKLAACFAQWDMALPPFGFGMELIAGDETGYALFDIDHDSATIALVAAACDDDLLLDAAIRAGYAAAEGMGCIHVDHAPQMPAALAERLLPLGHRPGRMTMDDFFGSCESGI